MKQTEKTYPVWVRDQLARVANELGMSLEDVIAKLVRERIKADLRGEY